MAPFDTSQWLIGLPCPIKVDLTWLCETVLPFSFAGVTGVFAHQLAS